MVKVQTDTRFTHITGCCITGLYKKIPHMFGGYILEIRFKIDDNHVFGEHKYIHIDESKFLSDITELFEGKKDRIYFTFGMGDIDIFKKGDDYVIYWSPNDGMYHYYFFPEEEFNKIKTWIELDNK